MLFCLLMFYFVNFFSLYMKRNILLNKFKSNSILASFSRILESKNVRKVLNSLNLLMTAQNTWERLCNSSGFTWRFPARCGNVLLGRRMPGLFCSDAPSKSSSVQCWEFNDLKEQYLGKSNWRLGNYGEWQYRKKFKINGAMWSQQSISLCAGLLMAGPSSTVWLLSKLLSVWVRETDAS